MAYAVSITSSAAKDIRRLDRKTQSQVAEAIDALASDPRPSGVRKIAGTARNEPPLYRIRVGDYRVIYQVADRTLTILVVRVRHRRDAYR